MCEEKTQEKKWPLEGFITPEEFKHLINSAKQEDINSRVVKDIQCIERSMEFVFNCNTHHDQLGCLKEAQKRLNYMVERWEAYEKELEEIEKIGLKNEAKNKKIDQKKTLLMARAPAGKKK